MRMFFFAFVAFSLIGCSLKNAENQNITASLDSLFKAQFPDNEPGCAALVIVDDSIVFSQGYGLADMESREPITPKTLFNLGSISKTFVANGILLLADQGKLSLDDSLIQYFPEFSDRSIANKIRIKHLLTHTSGLPDIRNVAGDSIYYLTAKDDGNWRPITQTKSLLFEPGSQFDYSNPAYNGLALIIEKASGMKWQQFISQNIFKVANMEKSTITDGAHPESGVSHAYVMNKGLWIEDDYGEEPTFPAAGNGGVWSSVEELAKYERALWNATFLDNKTIEASRTVQTFPNWIGTLPFSSTWSWFKPVDPGSPMIGWSWFISVTPSGEKIVGHTGSQGGFLCNYVSIPEKRFFFVILSNAPRDVYGISDKIMELISKYDQRITTRPKS